MQILHSYSIKDLETLTHVKSHTIRIWEKRYGILNPDRSDTNIRSYSNEDLKKLLNVSFLNQHGVKISKIALMSDIEIQEEVKALDWKENSDQGIIENLLLAMIDLDEVHFMATLNRSVELHGFEHTMTRIVSLYFERIGIMWQTDAIDPAQEHFVSNLVRNRIISQSDNLHIDASLPTIVLLLPENELHEIGLLYYNYHFRKLGHKTIYLGALVPIDNLQRIAQIAKAEVLITSLTNSLSNPDIASILQRLSESFPGKICASGLAIQYYDGPIPANVELFTAIEALDVTN